jgi:hypothetical protein
MVVLVIGNSCCAWHGLQRQNALAIRTARFRFLEKICHRNIGGFFYSSFRVVGALGGQFKLSAVCIG